MENPMKKMLPIVFLMVLVGLAIISWSNVLSYAGKEKKEYEGFISQGEALEEKEIYVDAVKQYEKALAMRPKNYDLAVRIAKLYASDKLAIDGKYISACKKAISIDKSKEEPYDMLIAYYCERGYTSKEYEILMAAAEAVDTDKYTARITELRGLYNEAVLRYDTISDCYYDASGTGYYIVKKDDIVSVITAEEETVLSGKYDELGFYSEFVAPVSVDGEWFYITKEGYRKLVPDEPAEYLGPFVSGFAPAKIGGKYGYLNKKMQKLHFEFDYAGPFCNGLAAVKKGDTWMVITTAFKKVGDTTFDDVLLDSFGICSARGVFFAKKDGKYYLYNKAGKRISDGFDEAKVFVSDEPAAVKSGGKWGFLTKAGKIAREPEYENADSFCAGYAPVYANGKWGVMDVDYNIVIEPKYDRMEAFEKDASAMVELEGKQLRIRMRIK